MRKRHAFTLIELLVVIAIIAILAAILFPIFAKAKETAKRTTCLNGLKQMGLSVKFYQEDSSGNFPSTKDYVGDEANYAKWVSRIFPYIKRKESLNCPAAIAPWNATVNGTTWKIGYCYNEYIQYRGYGFSSESTMRSPRQVLLIADGYRFALTHDWNDDLMANYEGFPSGINRIRYPDCLKGRYVVRHGGTNVVYCDSHVATIPIEQFVAKNCPGANNKLQCVEWPLIYPGATAGH